MPSHCDAAAAAAAADPAPASPPGRSKVSSRFASGPRSTSAGGFTARRRKRDACSIGNVGAGGNFGAYLFESSLLLSASCEPAVERRRAFTGTVENAALFAIPSDCSLDKVPSACMASTCCALLSCSAASAASATTSCSRRVRDRAAALKLDLTASMRRAATASNAASRMVSLLRLRLAHLVRRDSNNAADALAIVFPLSVPVLAT